MPKELGGTLEGNVNVSPEHPLREFSLILAFTLALLFAVYLALGWVAERVVTRISHETERRWFSSLAGGVPSAELDAVLAKVDDDPSRKVDIRETCERLENAYAMPGAQIRVTTGLLREVKTENGLAFVIAHELGHVRHRHALRQTGRQVLIVAFSQLLSLGGEAAAIFSQQGASFMVLSYSRAQEEEADRFAIEAVKRGYGHLSGAGEFFEKMREKYRLLEYIPPVFSTHPGTGERIAELARQAGPESRERPVIARSGAASACP